MARAPVQLPHQLRIARPVRHRNIGPLLRHRVDTAARLQRGMVTGGGLLQLQLVGAPCSSSILIIIIIITRGGVIARNAMWGTGEV